MKGPFARYSDTRQFLNLKNEERGQKEGKRDEKRGECRPGTGINGDGKKKIKERKHVRFKPEPQVRY